MLKCLSDAWLCFTLAVSLVPGTLEVTAQLGLRKSNRGPAWGTLSSETHTHTHLLLPKFLGEPDRKGMTAT